MATLNRLLGLRLRSMQCTSYTLGEAFLVSAGRSGSGAPALKRLKTIPCCQYIRRVATIPEDYRLVYEGPLSKSVKYVKLFSLTTCLASLIGSPILVFFGKESVPLVGKIALAGTVALVGSSTTFILHWLTKVYVHRMHFNPMERKFAIETYSLLARRKLIFLPVKDVRIPYTESAFSTFEGHGKKFFLHVEIREAQQVLNYIREYQVATDTANV